MILIVHEGNPALPEDRRRRARADPPGDDGRRGAAARPRRDLDHQHRLAGHGADRRDGPPHVAARPRDEGVAGLRGGLRLAERAGGRQRPGAPLPGEVHGRSRRACTGSQDEVGSLAPGHLADLVLWDAASFGAKPVAVMKGGVVAWGPIGEGNASVHGAEPTRYGPDWGATGDAAAALVDHVRLRRRARGGHRQRRSAHAAGSWPSAERGASDAPIWSRTPRCRRSRSRPTDGTVTLDGRVLAAEPVDERASQPALFPDVVPAHAVRCAVVHLAPQGPFPPDSIGICPKRGGPAPSAPAMGPSS